MSRLVIRRAETHDAEGIARVCAEGIARVCAAGWRDTYRGMKPVRSDRVGDC
jgi:hypothetical protein